MTSDGKQVCDRCGHPAAFRNRRGEEVCDVCANADHGEREGERYASAQMFGAAAQTARGLGVTAPELHALLADALAHESRHEPLDISAAVLTGESRADRRWLRVLDPIDGEQAA